LAGLVRGRRAGLAVAAAGNTWAVVYDEGHDDSGRRRQRWKSGFATRREAQAFLTDVLGRLGDGSYAQPSKITLAEFLTSEWLPAIEGTVRPLTSAQHSSTGGRSSCPASATCACRRSRAGI
jgi:Arm DNA-binding domain